MTDRRVKVYLDGDISNFNRRMLEASAGAKAFTNELDTSTDRMANLTQSALALGPALVPITAAAVPAVAGLSNQLGFAAAGAGVAVLAFHGLGKALDAVNQYSINPTDANLLKMRETLDTLGPAGEDFVMFLQRARPEIQHLQAISQAGLFPGVEKGMHSLLGLLPDVEHIIGTISTTLGDLATEAGANLDTAKWHEFIAFLDSKARPTLLAMGETAGNFATGLANLWMAFAPLSDSFSKSFLGLARDFSRWTDGLDQTKGFQEFVAYVNTEGPKAWEALGSLANALLQIVEAAAPVGAATLPVIKAIADAIAGIANSDMGPTIIGVVALTSAYSRLIALGKAANTGALGSRITQPFGNVAKAARDLPAASRAYLTLGSTIKKTGYTLGQFSSTSERLRTSIKGTAKLVGGAGGLAFVMSDLDDKMGLTNTATLALAGAMFGPWGAAVGGGIGLIKDLRAQHDNLTESIGKAAQATAAGSLSLAQQQKVLGQFGDALAAVDANLKGTGFEGVTDKAAAAYKAYKVQVDANARSAQDAKFAEAGLGTAMIGASQATRQQTEALLDNIQATNDAADAAENAFSAETNYRQALKDAQAQAKTNNAGIDDSSKAALANRTSLDQLASAWNRVADAGGKTTKDMKKARAGFIEAAVGMGVSRAAAEDLWTSLRHLPAAKKINVSVETNDALHKLNGIQTFINGMHGKTIKVAVKGGTPGGLTVGSAAGNIFAAYAGGGIENHVAQIGDGRFSRVWNEPETKGEAYIPLADDWRRPRAEAIWAQTGHLLGMQGFASGAILAPMPRPQSMASSFADGGIDYDRLASAMAQQPLVVQAALSVGGRQFALAVQDAQTTIARNK